MESAKQAVTLLDNTLKESLTSAEMVQSTANHIVQKAANTAEAVTANVMDTVSTATGSVKTVGESVNLALETARSALGAVNTVADTTGAVLKNTGTVADTATAEGAQVTNQAIRQASQVAQNALSLTGNTLETVFGSLNILAAKGSEKVRVKKEAWSAMSDVRRIAGLKSEIQSEFSDKMRDLVESLKVYSDSQKDFIHKLLTVYKTARCAKGKLYGYTCPPAVGEKVAAFQRKLDVARASSDAAASQLRGLIKTVEPSLMSIPETGLEQYKEAALNALKPLCVEAAGVYSRVVQHFSNVTEEINSEQNGGRKKRSVKYGRPRTHQSSARRPRRLPKSHRHAPRRSRAAPRRKANYLFR